MMKKPILSLIAAAALLLVSLPMTAVAADNAIPEIPAVAGVAGLSAYTDATDSEIFTEKQADSLSFPAGYTGDVMRLQGSSAIGTTLDFTPYKIPMSIVEGVTLRVYATSAVREVRVTQSAGKRWQLRYEGVKANQWDDILLSPTSNLYTGSSFDDLGVDGYLGVFELGYRLNSKTTVYFDGLTVHLKKDDGKAPVITYTGKTDLTATAGKTFVLDGASAHDAFEGRDVPLTYAWSSGAVDKEGKLLPGKHTCTVSAADFYGNTSSIKVTVAVGGKDVTPPTIHFTATEIKTTAGTIPQLTFTATDDVDEVTVTYEWSAGSLDAGGRLKKGTRTLTLTAVDRTGNTAKKTVKVIVS